MSAGSGIVHSEMNPFDERAHVIQMWVAPDEAGGDPYYSDIDVGEALGGGDLVAIASGRTDDAPARLRQGAATLWAAGLRPGETVSIPDAPFVHLFCARGALQLEGSGPLGAGDAARLRSAGERRVEAGGAGCELLAWEMWRELGRSGS